MTLKWKRADADADEGEWEARAGRHRYVICKAPAEYILARYITAPKSGKRYARYIPTNRDHRHLTLEEAKAAAQSDAIAVAAKLRARRDRTQKVERSAHDMLQ
jgi:hypothetical protein